MDILSHALWTNLIFKNVPEKNIVVLFSTLPDLISFSRSAIDISIRRLLSYNRPPKKSFSPVVYKLYNYTHSFIIWLGLYFMLKLLSLEFWIMAIYGWGLHIVADIFTHTKNYFPTPIMWPLSKFKFSGISWSNRYFMVFNYAALVFLYLIFYF